ncbi:L-lactate transporter-like isoform X3 [Bolinopsis microptera]|uniref:L-lactate transporter-like isoform X3 n=1 Tax=Bolinopsis microptera TaxID=2820187 RepID=UPI003078D6AF
METNVMQPQASANMNQTARGIVVLIGAVLIHITLGVLYCFGNISTYIVSYLRFRTDYDTVRFTNTQWILTLMVCGQGTTMVIGGLMERKIGARLTILVGCTIHTLTAALSFFAIRSFYALIVTYGVLFGFGIGIAYSPAMTLAMKWLPTYKGVVAGSVVAGFGLGAMVFNPIITTFINPNNTSPSYAPYPDHPSEKYYHDPEDSALLDRVPYCFLVMAGFFIALQVVGNLLLKSPPPVFEDFYESGVNGGSPSLQHDSSASNYLLQEAGPAEYTPLQLLKHRDFWILWFTFLCNNQGICYVSTYWKSFGQGFITDDLFLAGIGSAASVGNAFSRIIWGGIGDRLGFKVAMCTLQALFAMLYIIMFFTQHGKWGYAIFVFCLFFCVGGSFSLIPAVTIRTFGNQFCTANYGLVFTSGVVGALLNILILNLTINHGMSHQHVQWIIAAFLVAGFINSTFFKFRGCPCVRREETSREYGYSSVPYKE